MLYPTTGSVELVGASQLRSTSCATAIPVPVSATTTAPPVTELLLIMICPLKAPAVVGSNCSCNVKVCVGFSVTGKLPPTMVNPAPVIAAEFTVTGVVPVDVSVNDLVVVVFIAMLPKPTLVLLIVKFGFAALPMPLRITGCVPPVAELLLIVIWPLAAPVAVGSNCT